MGGMISLLAPPKVLTASAVVIVRLAPGIILAVRWLLLLPHQPRAAITRQPDLCWR